MIPAAVRLIRIDRSWHSQESDEVHSVEGDVKTNEEEPEVPLAKRLAQHPPRHFGIPVVNRRKDVEDDGAHQNVVKMSDYKIRVVQLPVPWSHRQHDPRESRDQELK